MIDITGIVLLIIVTLCFGFLTGFQMAHISYNKKLVTLVKRCINTGTIAPVLVEIEEHNQKSNE